MRFRLSRDTIYTIIDIFSFFLCYGFFLLFCGVIIYSQSTGSVILATDIYGEKEVELVLVVIFLPIITFSLVRNIRLLHTIRKDYLYF